MATIVYSSTKLPIRLVGLLKSPKAFLTGTTTANTASISYDSSAACLRCCQPSLETKYRKFYYMTDDTKKESYYDKKYLKNFERGRPFVLSNKTGEIDVRLSPNESSLMHQNMKQRHPLGPQHQPAPLRQSQQHVRFYGEYCPKQLKRRQPIDSCSSSSSRSFPKQILNKMAVIPSKNLESKQTINKNRNLWRSLSVGPGCNCPACDTSRIAYKTKCCTKRPPLVVKPLKSSTTTNVQRSLNQKAVAGAPQQQRPSIREHNLVMKMIPLGPQCNCLACEQAINSKMNKKIEFLQPDNVVAKKALTIRELLCRRSQLTMPGSSTGIELPPINSSKLNVWSRIKSAEPMQMAQ